MKWLKDVLADAKAFLLAHVTSELSNRIQTGLLDPQSVCFFSFNATERYPFQGNRAFITVTFISGVNSVTP